MRFIDSVAAGTILLLAAPASAQIADPIPPAGQDQVAPPVAPTPPVDPSTSPVTAPLPAPTVAPTPPMTRTDPMQPTMPTPGMTDAQSGMQAPAMPATGAMSDRDWARYDTSRRGQLDMSEFGRWVMSRQGQGAAMRGRGGASAQATTRMLNATAAEFIRADTNGDKMISPEEMRAYMGG